MQSDRTESVRDVGMSEEVQLILADHDHVVGLRRTRTVRVTTQDIQSSACAESASKSESWKEWFLALFLTGLRAVRALRDLTFCEPTSVLGETIDGTLVPRGSLGCLRRTPLAFKNRST
ncbi:MAG: hypothetical protein HDKAJFGB_03999 [Anaerolineae bacterium]|nr:hypothetical protein [Anaerolineae bacterium]